MALNKVRSIHLVQFLDKKVMPWCELWRYWAFSVCDKSLHDFFVNSFFKMAVYGPKWLGNIRKPISTSKYHILRLLNAHFGHFVLVKRAKNSTQPSWKMIFSGWNGFSNVSWSFWTINSHFKKWVGKKIMQAFVTNTKCSISSQFTSGHHFFV